MIKYRRLIWAVVLFILIILSLSVVLSFALRTKVRQRLDKEIAIVTKDAYKADFSTLEINLFALKASIRGVSLVPREETISSDSAFGSLHIEKIEVNKPSFFWLFEKKSSAPKFNITVSELEYVFPDSLYYINIGEIKYAWRDSSLLVRDLKYKSFVDKYQFAHHDPKHSDWMDLELSSFRMENVALEELLHSKSLLVDQISLDNVVFRNFKNQKIEITHHIMPILYEQVQGIPYSFRIKKVSVNNLSVYYQELAKNGIDPGEIFFTEMNVESENFTNIPATFTQTNQLNLSCKLMGEGQINAQMYFPVDTAYNHAEIKGTLGPMTMISLNRIIEPLAFARIKDGMIQGMDFHITGSKERANIDMCFLYHNLAVEIFKRDDDVPKMYESIFLSVLANNLIKKNNPEKGEPPRRVYAQYERDPLHSSFNYLWKIYFSGLIETLGYTKPLQERVNWIREEVKKIKEE